MSRIEKKKRKRKRQLPEPTESVIIHAQQNLDVDGGLNPVKIELEDGRIINILKKHKNPRDRLTPLGFLIPSSVKNDTEQIFITCRELNDVNKSLTNGKIYELLGIIDLNKINNWKEGVKGQSIWINTTLEEQKEINSRKHILFPFTISSLNDLISFSINLIDDNNKEIEMEITKKSEYFELQN